ncbi:hypothetical protein [Pseudidiomarina mangrovi]|uniref:hypothetical protein n=1 Tax=Pseudidiomarina mangrovi TaxID=2487133 RepID=UPI000FCBC46B|nr:hypothetical protein [Pseudidiomarina mangrovi]
MKDALIFLLISFQIFNANAEDSVEIIQPFGGLNWGDTRVEAKQKICSSDAFIDISNRESYCMSDDMFFPYFDSLHGKNRQSMDERLESSFDNSLDYNKGLLINNVQLISTHANKISVAPIFLEGIPYELELLFAGLRETTSYQYLEHSDSASCFVFSDKEYCELPPLLISATLAPLNKDALSLAEQVRDDLENMIYNRFGEELRKSRSRYSKRLDHSGTSVVFYPQLLSIQYDGRTWLEDKYKDHLDMILKSQIKPKSSSKHL